MNVVIAANHHRRSIFFENTIKLFSEYHVVIQETGGHSIWGDFGVNTSNIQLINNREQITYDESMVRYKDILSKERWDIVVFLDNDLFMTSNGYFLKTLRDFVKDDYDFCSYFEVGSEDHYEYKNTIAEVNDQQFKDVPEFPNFKPVPHWENAFMYLTRDLYNQLTPSDLSNSRMMIKKIHFLKAKMGVKKTSYRGVYSHYGPDWLHMGNLMKYYYAVESANMGKLERHGDVDRIRMGYFLMQEAIYGEQIYPQPLWQVIQGFVHWMGKTEVENAWHNFIQGTCLEDYECLN